MTQPKVAKRVKLTFLADSQLETKYDRNVTIEQIMGVLLKASIIMSTFKLSKIFQGHLRKLLSYRQRNKLLQEELKRRLMALSYLFHSLKTVLNIHFTNEYTDERKEDVQKSTQFWNHGLSFGRQLELVIFFTGPLLAFIVF